jgi:hypothetical protein
MSNVPIKTDEPRFIQPGSIILKCVDGRWQDRDELPVAGEMLVTRTAHGLQCFKNGEMLGELLDRPGKRWTKYDAEELNAKIPEEEWGVGFNNEPQAPWRETWAVYLTDANSASEYTFINSTRGAAIAVERLERRMEITCALKGANIRPRVKLESRPMPIKRLGITKQRPEFTIVEWIDLTGDGEVLLGRKQGPLQIEHTPPTTVQPPAVSEEINDDLPLDLATPKKRDERTSGKKAG